MASPFSVFRKNQKVWMAGVTIVAIFAFVFMGGPMLSFFNASAGHEVPIVRTTKFGNLDAGQLYTLRLNRMEFNEFLDAFERNLDARKQSAIAISRVRRVIGPATDAMVVNKWLFAREAEAMGITVDDKTLTDFLTVLTNGSSHDDLVRVLRSIRQGISEATFLSILREELLALRYRQLFHQMQDDDLWVGGSATPDERWTTFKRLNQQATIEVALFSPQYFTKQVAAPAEQTLKDFFEAHKEADASPYSPEPGFHVPRKVNIEYLQASEETYRSLVTENEITKRYEKDPKSYARQLDDFEQEEKKERASREREDAAEKAAAEKKAEKKPETGKKPDTQKKPEAEKKPETDKKPDANKKPDTGKTAPAPSKPTADAKPTPDTKPAPDAKPNPGPKGPEPAKAAPGAKTSGSSTELPHSPFRLVAFAEDKPAEKAGQTKDEKKQPAADQKPADDKKPAQGKQSEAVKKTGEGKKPDAKSTASETTKKGSEEKKPQRPPIKTAMQRLREQIRDEIAQEKLQEKLSKVQALLADWRKEKWLPYDAEAKSNPGAEKPTPPDFAVLAGKNMSADRTGLVSQFDLMETDLGKSINRQQRMSVYQLTFGATTLYKPDVSEYPGLTRTYFVSWKTDDQPAHVPNWEDAGIQTEVLRVWKLTEARKLALKRADELKAEAAKNPGKPLDKLDSGKKKDFTVLRPPEFSFLSQMYGQLQLGEVFGLEKVGPDFMQAVFGLAPNQVDVAANRPKTEIYLIRAVEFTPFKELWSNFTSEADEWSVFTLFTPNGVSERTAGLIELIRDDQGAVSQAWLKKVHDDAGLKWEKQTDQQRSAPGQGPGPSPIDED